MTLNLEYLKESSDILVANRYLPIFILSRLTGDLHKSQSIREVDQVMQKFQITSG